MQLELANMYKNNDLHRLWMMANQTDLTFNLVRNAWIAVGCQYLTMHRVLAGTFSV